MIEAKLIISEVYAVMGWLWLGKSITCLWTTANIKERHQYMVGGFVWNIRVPMQQEQWRIQGKHTWVLDILFDKTDHNNYFTKFNFGSKQKFKSMHNCTLPFFVLTWLRKLQQFFFVQKERDTKGDWNNYRKYWGTSSLATKHHPLMSINIAQANRDQRTPVDNINLFSCQTKKNRECVFPWKSMQHEFWSPIFQQY